MATNTQADDSSTPGTPESHRALVAVGNRALQLPAASWPYAGQLMARPEILSASPSPVDLLQSLRRRWPLGLGLGMVVAGILAGLVWVLVPIRYEAQSLIKISKVLPVVIQNVQNGGIDEGAAYEIYKKTQLQWVKSPFVLNRAARKPEMVKLETIREHKDDPAGYLEGKLIIDYPGDAEILRVAIKGTHREDLPVIVNAVVQAYMDEIVVGDKMTRLKQRDLLSKHLSENKEQYRELSASIHQLSVQMESASSQQALMRKKLLTMRLESLVGSSNLIAQRLRDNELQIKLLEERQKKSGEEGTSTLHSNEPLIEAEFMHDPDIIEYNKRMADLRLLIKEQESLVKDRKSWMVETLRRRLSHLEEQVNERKAELDADVRARVNEFASKMGGPSSGDPETMLPLMKVENETLRENLAMGGEELERQMKEYAKFDRETADLENRETQLEDLKTIIKRISYQLSLWNLELDAEQRIKVMDEAVKPTSDDALQKYLGVGFAGVVGFGVVLFGIAYIEFQSRRLNSVSEVKEGLGLPVVGELPVLSGKTWRKIRSGSPAGIALEGLLSESVDNIRTRLLHASGVESPRVIMVTSAEPREGKTTVASQLATSLARSGRRTLLVDGDVRNPTINRVFELALDPGLCEVLRGDVDREAALQPSRTPQLWVLAAGRCCLQSVQALSQAALADLLTALRSEFEFIVIDAAPVLKLADPLLFGQHVDVALLSVLRDISKTPEIYEAVERLKSVGIAVLGTVVNGVNDGARRYSGQLAMREQRPAEVSS